VGLVRPGLLFTTGHRGQSLKAGDSGARSSENKLNFRVFEPGNREIYGFQLGFFYYMVVMISGTRKLDDLTEVVRREKLAEAGQSQSKMVRETHPTLISMVLGVPVEHERLVPT
jgi:hypothetical protein